ncbi:hypothetical protein, partial [uncultured Phocaeicola sp.]
LHSQTIPSVPVFKQDELGHHIFHRENMIVKDFFHLSLYDSLCESHADRIYFKREVGLSPKQYRENR